MTDPSVFEQRLDARLRARAALASRPFDAMAIAHDAVAAGTRRRGIGALGWTVRRPVVAWLLIVLLLAIGLLGTVVLVGALLRHTSTSLPANGLIAVSANPWGVGGGEAGDIYLVSESGGARRIIGSDGDGVAQACPRFSSDGLRLAYGEATASDQPVTSFRGRWPVADRAVIVVGLNDLGDASPPIMRVSGVEGAGPIPCAEWSPTGADLAFRVEAKLWIATVSTGQTQVVPIKSQSGWEQDELEWSHDGSLIAVAEPGQIQVARVDDGTSYLIPVVGSTPWSLGWTAGDERIVYLSTDPVGDGYGRVHVVNADGKNDTRITPEATDPGVQAVDTNPIVSRDGTRVAYGHSSIRCTTDGCTGDAARLLLMNTDGSSVIEVMVPSDFGAAGMQWSPDGRRLLLGSIAGVISVAVAPGSPPIVHSKSGELNLEWSSSELTWQPVFR